MDNKPWYEKVSIWIGIIASICAILGVRVFDDKSLIKNTVFTEEETTSTKNNDKQDKNTITEEKTTEYVQDHINGNIYVKITSETLCIRNEPNVDSEVVTLADQGDTFLLIENLNEWYKIAINEHLTGYVASYYTEITTKNEIHE